MNNYMKNISISTFLNIIFILAFAAIITSFMFFIRLDQEKLANDRKDRYNFISNTFLSGLDLEPSKDQLSQLYEQFEVKPIKDRLKKLEIIKNGKMITMRKNLLGRSRVYKQNNKFYVYVQKLSYNIMLQDAKEEPYNKSIALILFILSLSIFFTMFILLKKKLTPLKVLDKQIQKFSNGDTSINLDFDHDDEIGKIARSFNKAITNINNLTSSKSLFMRNMMHELKTPITKAMFIVEVLPENKNKETLKRAFERMDTIIKELSTVEKITSSMNVLYKEDVDFFHIYNNTINLLLISPDKISSKINDFKLEVDVYLFSIVLKNLIDNAIKFSPNNHACIRANKRYIEVISLGEKLQHSIDYYTEPFSQEEKRSDGFGLGLYIVKTICELHGFTLKYEYKEGKNYFIINMQKKFVEQSSPSIEPHS